MKFILGNKLEMTQMWVGEEKKAVTKIKVGPCTVLQVKTKANDGYEAVQLGFGEKSVKNIAKPQRGHMKDFGNFRWLREFRLDKKGHWGATPELKAGDVIDVSTWSAGEKVTFTATVKGRGFAGVVKRHGFHGHNATHGTKDQVRMPGSIGAGGVQHVFKGVRMAGRMGGNPVTMKDAEIIAIDEKEGIIYLEGGVPGARGGLVKIYAAGELKLKQAEAPKIEEAVVEASVATETAAEAVAEQQETAEANEAK